MRHFSVPRGEHASLIDFLASSLRISKKKAKLLLDAKKVFVNGQRIWMAKSEVQGGDSVEVQEESAEVNVDPRGVLFQDESCLVFAKPAGITTNGPESLELQLREALHSPTLLAVHRLDKDTSGCVIFSKSRAIKDKFEALFRAKKISKSYRAIVIGWVPGDIEEIKTPIDGKPALTKVKIISANEEASHLELSIPTGRTHQIRKHLASIQHSVIGDKDYLTKSIHSRTIRDVPRQMLHAMTIGFQNPVSGEEINVVAPLPKDFKAFLKKINLT